MSSCKSTRKFNSKSGRKQEFFLEKTWCCRSTKVLLQRVAYPIYLSGKRKEPKMKFKVNFSCRFLTFCSALFCKKENYAFAYPSTYPHTGYIDNIWGARITESCTKEKCSFFFKAKENAFWDASNAHHSPRGESYITASWTNSPLHLPQKNFHLSCSTRSLTCPFVLLFSLLIFLGYEIRKKTVHSCIPVLPQIFPFHILNNTSPTLLLTPRMMPVDFLEETEKTPAFLKQLCHTK